MAENRQPIAVRQAKLQRQPFSHPMCGFSLSAIWGCWHLLAKLSTFADNHAGNCRQGCCQLPKTTALRKAHTRLCAAIASKMRPFSNPGCATLARGEGREQCGLCASKTRDARSAHPNLSQSRKERKSHTRLQGPCRMG